MLNSSLQVEGETYQLKPMNCPFHVEIYKNSFYSYRDLPLRWAELGTVYRYERSGAMQGLFRVRGFTQVCSRNTARHPPITFKAAVNYQSLQLDPSVSTQLKCSLCISMYVL